MGMQWTEEQQKVIDLRKRNILVSAAAGSGKTAVLVERIISRLTKDNPPTDVDRMLIVTFTEAAAAEMKERIANAINKALEEDPDNEHLKRQAALIYTAKITTIHSFCLSVIRDYFHTIDLDPGFRIAEEGELKLLKQDVMQELLENKYQEGEQDFLRFVETFATGRDDKELEELIEKLYDFSGSYPDPDEWLDQSAEYYKNIFENDNVIGKTILDYTKKILGNIVEDMDAAAELCSGETGPFMYLDTIEADRTMIQPLLETDTYSGISEKLRNIGAWVKLAANRNKDVDKECAQLVKDMRDTWKKSVTTLKDLFFFQSVDEMKKDMEDCVPIINVLTGLVKEFQKNYAQKKSEKNIIDFRDMEQFALRILTRKENGQRVPSEVAAEYQEQFDEVMIDEYQDSNLIQEAILTSVSKMSRGENNLFMVGDVKQSIYRFRLSRPELFMEKFDTYSVEDSECQRIDLHKNFRSRAEVLDSTNDVFRKIMVRELGKIKYDDNAALYVGADYPKCEGNETELMVIDTDLNDEGDRQNSEQSRETEAKYVAERIHELMKVQKVWDKNRNEMRDIEYRDIVVLSRSVSGWADVFSKVLNREGIPAITTSKEGYFGTLEISWMMDYLRVLDNIRQDLPLTAVLKSPFGGLSDEELAVIRETAPEKPFHECVLAAVESEADEQIIPEQVKRKLDGIFKMIFEFRKKVPYTSIYDLLWEIMNVTGYKNYIQAMPGGGQRYANLEMLLVKARAFESTSYKGLFHFVRYMDQLKKYNVDFGEANIYNEQTDAVRIMSIHKSKGLEFPVVFVVGMGKAFNTKDKNSKVVIHPELGIGIDRINLEHRTKTPTLLKKVIQTQTGLENLGEELRVLYVAMTRAKEKLIMTGTLKSADKKMTEYYNKKRSGSQPLAFNVLSGARSYFDWVIPAVFALNSSTIKMEKTTFEDVVKKEIVREDDEILDKEIYLQAVRDREHCLAHTDAKFEERIDEQFSYRYPYEEAGQIKLKYSVSELKKRAYEEASTESEQLIEEKETVPLVPGFLQEDKKVTGAPRGTAYHKIMELLDFTGEYTRDMIGEFIEHAQKEGYMTPEMAESIYPGDILRFMDTATAKRMKAAAEKGKLFKEQPFVFGIDSGEMYPDSEIHEQILIQGIIDAYFEEDGELVVLDYKTDRISNKKELIDRYKEQLDLYERALEQITGKKVRDKLIYSFTLRQEIEL